MKSTPLIINWHDQNAPIYSAHFEPHGKGRLATAGGDNNVRLWKVDGDGENRSVEYLATLVKHTQAVNVVRWCPKGELLASAGDDGNVILWVPSESHHPTFGNDGVEDKESWRTKHMCRSSGAEIYDLAWSPDGLYFIIGSMDNIARIYNAATGAIVRQIAEHSHYVQGVAWDPLNEYIATQSSDRSVHVYSLKNRDGQYTLAAASLAAGLDDKPAKIASHAKADLPPRRLAPQSPAPSELGGHRAQLGAALDNPGGGGGGGGGGSTSLAPTSIGSPVPSTPGTPTSFALPMNPPSIMSHSRRSSFSSRRSVSPAPSMPLPAVMPMEPSPKPHPTSASFATGMKNASLYANETLTSFFRRLTFTPDGSLLLTPAGQYQTQHLRDGAAKPTYEITNTVYIYSRGGISKAPIAHLPGHKKPSVAVRCSPVVYALRQPPAPPTKHITIDTSSPEEPIPALPAPLTTTRPAGAAAATAPSPVSTPSFMEPPPPPPPPSSSSSAQRPSSSHDTADAASPAAPPPAAATAGPKPMFSLPHRMIYAVATQDAVLLYDTQQQTPLCVVSNLHCATFTDLTWSSDGLTLLISSSDGFCSTLSFSPGELGQPFTGDLAASTSGFLAATSAQKQQPPPLGPLAQVQPLAAAQTALPAAPLAPPSPYHVHHHHLAVAHPLPPPPSSGGSVSGSSSGGGGGGHHHGHHSHHGHHHRHSASSSFTAPSPPASTSAAASASASASAIAAGAARPASPSRSNSTSSAGGVANNPPLTVGSVPALTASAAATPPATPRNRASSVASSVAGSVAGAAASSTPAASAPAPAPAPALPPAVAGTKRDASESEQDGDGDGSGDGGGDAAAAAADGSGKAEPAKKRRIAPTLVRSNEG